MSFQAMVGTWFAAHVVTATPVGTRFGLNLDVLAAEIQFETGDTMDDAVVRLKGGGAIYLQCKTRPFLERGADSPLAKTLAQCAAFLVQHRTIRASVDPDRVATVLAVADNAPKSLDALEYACRQFDTGESWSSVIGRVPEGQRDALEVFKLHTDRSWLKTTGAGITDDDLVELARLFRVRRFGEDTGSADWREITRLVGNRLYKGEEFGERPTAALLNVVRQLIRSGAAADRAGLVRALRAAGYPETRAPGYNDDIVALNEYTREECDRLSRHAVLEADRQVPLPRECLPALRAAINGGSLLVIGEPGAGKTGVLVGLAQQMRLQAAPFVFLSVDRLAGISKMSELGSELKLQHDLLEVLAAWPGDQPGILMIDALDASRGGPSEAVFASFIELALPKVGDRWAIVASIRTFDLMNGRRFREGMRGRPPAQDYAVSSLSDVRHFLIKALSPGELAQIGGQAPKLGELLDTAPDKLKALLRNIFNLSLAADLIRGGVASDAICAVSTQSELIDRYEDERLPKQTLKRAAAATIAAMVAQRRLSVRQIDVQHDAVDEVLRAGVLARAGDLVGFAHHVIFDHVAGRYYLAWNDINHLAEQVSGESGTGLMLGPALRFAMERIWRDDDRSRTQSWALLRTIVSSPQADPIVLSIALRTIVERVENEDDIQGLIAILADARTRAIAASMLSRLARFVGMSAKQGATASVARAWSVVAEAAAMTGDRVLADGARVLLILFAERSDFDNPHVATPFGSASRSLLRLAWRIEPYTEPFVTAGIRCVARSFGSDTAASRTLLQRVLEEPHFSNHAYIEAPTLAENVRYIIPQDPDFAATIYSTLFERAAPEGGQSWFGGQPSRILPLTMDRTQQYEHAFWHLNKAIELFLALAPSEAISAVIGAVRGASLKRKSHPPSVVALQIEGRSLRIIDELQSLQEWRKVTPRGLSSDETVLDTFVQFLTKASPKDFRLAVMTAIAAETPASIWARILRIASERPGIADDLLWPLASTPAFASIRGLARDAVIYLTCSYGARSDEDRKTFETAALTPESLREGPTGNWWRSLMARLLSGLEEGALTTDAMKAFRTALASEKRLTGNSPFVSFQSGFAPVENVTDVLLANDGVNLEKEPERSIRAALGALEDTVKVGRGNNAPADIAVLWTHTSHLVTLIDREANSPPHPELLHAAWGAVSEAVDQITKNESYEPTTTGHPVLSELLSLNARLAQSPYPQPGNSVDDESGHLAWGNWDVRVNAAAAAMRLAQRFADMHPETLNSLESYLRDPVRTVRLQVAQSINGLWEVARERMWELTDYIAQNEPSRAVLAYFISGPLGRIAQAEAQRTERLLSHILDRSATGDGDGSGPHEFFEAVGSLVAWLCVATDNANAWSRMVQWSDDLTLGDSFLWSVTTNLREPLFFGYRPPIQPLQVEMRGRAKRIMERIVAAAVRGKTQSKAVLQGGGLSEADRASTEALYVAGERLLDHACNQFNFGASVLGQGGEASDELDSPSEKRQFLVDYRELLDQLGQHGSAQTIHHLVELYVLLVEASPPEVFDQIAAILTGPALAENYHFEALGADALVSLVKLYLADYRDIFEDPDRRSRLVSVLEEFSKAGWPEALKLLYELPDLLR